MDYEIGQLINEIGKTIVLRKKTSGAYNPETSSATISNSDYSARGLILDFKDRDRDGTIIKAGDRKAIFKAADLSATPPKINDFVVLDNKEFQIVTVRTVEKSGVALTYHCQIRG